MMNNNKRERRWIDAWNSFTMLGTANKDTTAPFLLLALLMRWYEVPSEAWTPYLIRINKIRALSGTPFTVKWNKAVRLCFTRWICGHPLRGYGVPLHEDGFPKPLSAMKPWCSSRIGRALTLTMLTWSRALTATSTIDRNLIEDPYTGSWSEDDVEKSVKAFLRWSGNRPTLRIKPWTWWHLSTKAGPNGHAITSWWDDLTVISKDDVDAFKTLCGEKMVTILSHLRFLTQQETPMKALKEILKLSKVKDPIKARLVWIKDKELKIRSIGIGNYWYQNALQGIHDSVMEALRRIPEDMTFHQGDALRILKKPVGHSYWSLDLTAATDRFPLWFQKFVLTYAFSPAVADSWTHLMSTEFSSRYGKIRYAVGQPMGYLSSWAVFALSHHYVVYLAAKRAGLRSHRGLYVLLGDDIVIAHDDLAREYKNIIHHLGVGLSESKTHQSENLFEFAKRWYCPDGEEHSPFPIHAVSLKAKYTDLVALGIKAEEKGWVITPSMLEFLAEANCLLWRNLGDACKSRSLDILDLYNAAANAAIGRGSWDSVLRRTVSVRRTISPVPTSFAHYADEVVSLVLRVMFVTKGLGSLAIATEKGNSFIAKLLPTVVKGPNPFKGMTKILINVPQVHVYSQMVEEFSRIPRLELRDMYQGKTKNQMISLIVTDLDTLMTERSQTLNWAVLSRTVRALVVLMSRLSSVGLTFTEQGRMPDGLLREILRPITAEDVSYSSRYSDPDSHLNQLWSRGVSLRQQDDKDWDPSKAKGYSVFRRLNYLTSEGKVSSYLYGERG
nr:putative RNA-dependent RNA polymerase [Puccinia striiformis mitovirus 2]